MASVCDTILAADIIPNCASPLVKGFEADGVIIPRSYIENYTISSQNPNEVQEIQLVSGKRGYKCIQQGATPFSGSTQTLTVGTYANTWESSVQLLVPTWGSTTAKDIVDALSNSDNVVILRNKLKNDGASSATGTTEYQIFGLQNGMRASAGERDANSDDTLGGVLLTLTESGAPKSGMFLVSGTAATTKQMYDSLTADPQ